MTSTIKYLQRLLADNKTNKVVKQLLVLTKTDHELYNEVLQLSSQFAEIERQSRLNIADPTLLATQRNRINNALLNIISHLQQADSPLKQKWSIRRIAIWLTFFLVLTTITTYTLRNFLITPKPMDMEESVKEEKKSVAPVVQTKGKPAVNNLGKNNPNITVKGNAKVGTIITGDSNKIDIKQGF